MENVDASGLAVFYHYYVLLLMHLSPHERMCLGMAAKCPRTPCPSASSSTCFAAFSAEGCIGTERKETPTSCGYPKTQILSATPSGCGTTSHRR